MPKSTKFPPLSSAEKLYVLAAPLIIVLLTMWVLQIWLAAPAPEFDPYASRDVPQTVPK